MCWRWMSDTNLLILKYLTKPYNFRHNVINNSLYFPLNSMQCTFHYYVTRWLIRSCLPTLYSSWLNEVNSCITCTQSSYHTTTWLAGSNTQSLFTCSIRTHAVRILGTDTTRFVNFPSKVGITYIVIKDAVPLDVSLETA